MQYDYSAIHSLQNLQHLSINTTDKKEIDFSVFPYLTSVALTWRPKAKSLFSCVQLQRLFLNRYTGQDLHEVSNLKNLKFLRVNLGSVTSLSGLNLIAGLEELMLMQTTKLEDIEDLLTLKHLKRLRIDNCKRVRNISAVKKMNVPKLEIVGTTPDD
jgi:Leucine-rich repeat (LRR) protein